MTDTAAEAQDAADGADTAEEPNTPAAPEIAGSGGDSGQDGADQPDAETFPRHVVEKLRKENAGYRDRAKMAEQRVSALQRQAAEQTITAAGMKPEAVWAVAKLDDLLDDQGAVDTAKLTTAMAAARDTLGIGHRPQRQKAPGPDTGGMRSGLSRPKERQNDWAAAFGPNQDRRV